MNHLLQGDSGLFVIRDGKVVFETEHQNHIFGVPFQLSSDHSKGTGSSGSGYELAEKQSKIPAHENLAALTVVQLKDELRQRNLRVSGRKKDLIDRIREHDSDSDSGGNAETTGKFFNTPDDADVRDVRTACLPCCIWTVHSLCDCPVVNYV